MDSSLTIDQILIINNTIERLWYFFSDPSTLYLSNPNQFSLIKTTQSIPIYSLHSSFLISSSSITFNCTCIKSDSTPFIKTITWLISSIHFQTFSVTITLYHVSINDSTIIKLEISNLTNDLHSILSIHLNGVIKNINEYILRTNTCLYQNEGIIIETDIETAWDCLLDWENEKKISMDYYTEKDMMSCDKSIYEPGAMISIYNKSDGKEVRYKVNHVSRNEKHLKWEYCLDVCSESDYEEIRWTFIKIDEERCYVSLCHLLKKNLESNLMSNMSKCKKEYIIKMKEVAEEKKNKAIKKVNNE